MWILMTGSKTSWSIRAGQGLLFLFVNTHVAGAQWEQTPLCRRLSELRGSKCNKEIDHRPGDQVAVRMGISVISGQGLSNPLALSKTWYPGTPQRRGSA